MRSDFLVYEAKSFYNAYIALEQLSKADTTPELLLYAPMVVNGSFSIELTLKAILVKNHISYGKEHNLLVLFRLLPKPFQDELLTHLIEKAPEYINPEKCVEELVLLSNAFVDWRYDSTNERDFAADLDTNTDVAVYVKLPDSFYIATPVGHYNPDWAIAFYEGTVKHIYFVAETKGSMSSMQLRLIEESKIHCAREHFKAISNGNVVYDVVDSYQSLLEKVMK